MRIRWLLVVEPPLMWMIALAVLWPGPWDRLVNPWFMASVAFYVAGAVLLFKAPGNAIGWMMMGFPATTAVAILGIAIAVELGFSGSGAAWADTIGNAFASVAILFLPLILMYFPDGRLPSPGWRHGPILVAVGAVAGFLAAMLNGGWGGDPEDGSLESPLRAATAPAGDVVSALFFILLLTSFAIGGWSLARRFLKSHGIERRQIKWVAFAGATLAMILAVELAVFGMETLDRTWGELLMVAGVVAVPAAVAIAVLRYRLYDIDRIVSRTVGYVVVLGVLTTVYALGAVWLPTRLLGEQTPLFVAGATLAAAALFNPLRRRVLDWVDRRFYRSRYDAERIAEAFSSRLRDQVDVDILTADWSSVVTTTLRPSALGIWLNERE